MSKHKYYLITYPQLDNRTTIVRNKLNAAVKVIATSIPHHWQYLNALDLKYIIYRNKSGLRTEFEPIIKLISGKRFKQEIFRIQMLGGKIDFKEVTRG